jgi:DNA-binding NtrC family response regulator
MEIVILTGHGSVDSAVDCTKTGAYLYLQKPCELETLLEALKNAYKKKIMNKNKIEEKKLNDLLEIAQSNSPRDIMRRLKEIDNRIIP